MKNLIMIALVLGSANAARADGFVCTSLDREITARAYNHVDPSEGTRVPSKLVISDNTVDYGRRTITSFSDQNGTLTGGNFTYNGRVDLRFNESGAKGEYIGGTRLGELSEISLNVYYTYGFDPIADGEVVTGTMTLTKRDGDASDIAMECTRYLKN